MGPDRRRREPALGDEPPGEVGAPPAASPPGSTGDSPTDSCWGGGSSGLPLPFGHGGVIGGGAAAAVCVHGVGAAELYFRVSRRSLDTRPAGVYVRRTRA